MKLEEYEKINIKEPQNDALVIFNILLQREGRFLLRVSVSLMILFAVSFVAFVVVVVKALQTYDFTYAMLTIGVAFVLVATTQIFNHYNDKAGRVNDLFDKLFEEVEKREKMQQNYGTNTNNK